VDDDAVDLAPVLLTEVEADHGYAITPMHELSCDQHLLQFRPANEPDVAIVRQYRVSIRSQKADMGTRIGHDR
jgi:hypothetical protein